MKTELAFVGLVLLTVSILLLLYFSFSYFAFDYDDSCLSNREINKFCKEHSTGMLPLCCDHWANCTLWNQGNYNVWVPCGEHHPYC
jgi:hypothetical protein